MSYSDTTHYLYNLRKYGIKFGLDNIQRLTYAFNNPHTSYDTIHIGGTNGKGSTAALISSILKNAGFRVGLFTSPHLVSFTERITVNGKEITEHEVIELAEVIRNVVARKEDFSPTFFEVVVMMAFLYFKRKQVDVAVVEVGMGGRLDATNIITPLLSVITNIDYDHKEFLGYALKEIAREKAGIIKTGVPVVSSLQQPEAMDVIKQKAREKNSKLYVFGKEFSSLLKRETISEICFDYYSGNSLKISDVCLPLAGEYQMQNASVAIKAAMMAIDRLRFDVAQNQIQDVVKVIRDGLYKTRWPGRLEFILKNPPILIDGAHNPAAANALSGVLKKNFLKDGRRLIAVLGIMGDKDARGIMEPLLPLASEVILTAPEYSRAAAPETLAGIARSLGCFHVRIASTVKDAIEKAIAIANSEFRNGDLNPNSNQKSLVLIAGSFYTIGEAKEVIGTKGVLSGLRE